MDIFFREENMSNVNYLKYINLIVVIKVIKIYKLNDILNFDMHYTNIKNVLRNLHYIIIYHKSILMLYFTIIKFAINHYYYIFAILEAAFVSYPRKILSRSSCCLCVLYIVTSIKIKIFIERKAFPYCGVKV